MTRLDYWKIRSRAKSGAPFAPLATASRARALVVEQDPAAASRDNGRDMADARHAVAGDGRAERAIDPQPDAIRSRRDDLDRPRFWRGSACGSG